MESAPVSITVLDVTEPVAEDVVLGEPGTATLTATGEDLEWYATETSTEVLGTGNSFETPVVNTSASYWVEAHAIFGGEVMDGGKPDNSGGGGLPSTGGRLYFNTTEAFTLTQVTAYVPDNGVAGDRTIRLYDGNGTLITSATAYCNIGANVLDLNFEIGIGEFQIDCAEANLFRNNSGVVYPYAIGDVGNIYNTTNGTSYYYYFYDWQIQKASWECSSQRVEVMVTVVGIEELASAYGIQVYPNPAAEQIQIQATSDFQPTKLTITDITGRQVYSQKLVMNGGAPATINVSALAAGTYHLTLSDGKTSVASEIIKQ
jgi:hypothetical protein